MKKRKGIRISFQILLLILMILLPSAGVFAKSTAVKKSQWVENSAGRYLYYNASGKILKNGVYKIGSKYYCFDQNGYQRNGWQKIGNAYYYFLWNKGSKGYRISNATRNGIKTDARGKALKVTEKLKQLVRANEEVFRICNWKQNGGQALRACFNEARDVAYRNYGSFHASGYLKYYADRFFQNKNGDCHTQAIGFALLASARGFKNVYFVRASDHGWAEINGKIYDPNWARWNRDKGSKYVYGISATLGGKDGRYQYKKEKKRYRIDG